MAACSVACFGTACDKSEDAATLRRFEPKRAPVEAVAKALDVDASEFEPKLDPAAPPGDLRADLEAFTTVDACVQQRTRIDPMLGDALDAIGYDTFFADACRVIDAAKSGDAKRCREIAASSLRTRCRATVAELHADPGLCPWAQPKRPPLGRDTACVAVAARSVALCGAVSDPQERTACVALLARDAAGCQKLFSRTERERCTRKVARWQSALSAATPGVHADAYVRPAATLRVDRVDDGGGPPPSRTIDLTHELEGGTVLVEDRTGLSFILGTLTDDEPAYLAPPPMGAATFGIEVVVPRGSADAVDARVRRLQLQLPGQPLLVMQPSAAPGLTLHIGKLGRERGGAVVLTVDGPLGPGNPTIHLEGTTFVHDVVTAADIVAAAARHEDDVAPNGGAP